MHGDMLMFRARHHGHFPPLTSHGRSSHAAINKHTAHTRLHTRFGTSHNQLSFNALSALSRPLRCLTRTRSQLKIQEPRTMDTTRWFASSVTSSRSCHVAMKHLTVAAESRPFLALRYESRHPLPLRDSCDEDCATQGSMDDQSLCEALARYLDSRYAGEFEVLANSLN